jgi:hypothetical protein
MTAAQTPSTETGYTSGGGSRTRSTAYDVVPQNLILSTHTPIAGSTTYVLDDSGNMASHRRSSRTDPFPVAVTDRVTLMALSLGPSH